jgi:hypothetical protein
MASYLPNQQIVPTPSNKEADLRVDGASVPLPPKPKPHIIKRSGSKKKAVEKLLVDGTVPLDFYAIYNASELPGKNEILSTFNKTPENHHVPLITPIPNRPPPPCDPSS